MSRTTSDPATPSTSLAIGDRVRVKRGGCGEGYRFTVSTIGLGGLGETIVYGNGDTYGPVRASEVERTA